MRIAYKIGANMFIADSRLIDNDSIPDGYTIKVPGYKNADGSYTGYLRAKWSGTDWVEGATPEEIADVNTPSTPMPTLEQQQIAQLLLITAQQAQQIAVLQGASTNG